MQVSLPAQLTVDLLHCERAARQAVAESNGQLRLVQGELITAEYFDNLAAEIDEILQVCYPMCTYGPPAPDVQSSTNDHM